MSAANTKEIIKLTNKVMNLAMKAYITTDNQKKIIQIRQSQDIFLDKLLEMTSPETINKLQNEAIREFLNKKIKEKLKRE